MKRILAITTILAIALLLPKVSEAQIQNMLKKKALEAVKNALGEEEKAKPKEVQPQQPEAQTPKQQPTGPNFLEKKMLEKMGFANVKFDPSYNFSSTMVMEIETIDSLKRKDNVQYTTYFSPNEKNFAMIFDAKNRETGQKQKSTIVFDNKNGAMLILSEENGERKGIAMVVPPDTTASTATDVNNARIEGFEHPFYKATGRTKTIAGHSCKEYVYQTMEDKLTLWVTNETKVDVSKAYQHMYGFQAIGTMGMGYGLGMVMEMEAQRLISGESSHLIVKEINTNSPKSLDVSGYQVIGMGGGK